jgi:hypothetical protein
VKLWAPKTSGVLAVEISRLPFENRGTKWHLDVAPMKSCIEYYKGKVVASSKSGSWWILWVRGCPWLVLASKVFKLCTTNSLFGLYKFAWLISCLSIFLVPSWSSSTPLYPQNVASQGACFDSLLFRCFHFRLSFEFIKELGVHHLSSSSFLGINLSYLFL